MTTMFWGDVGLSREQKHELIMSLTDYVRQNRGRPGVAYFEAEIHWLKDEKDKAEALLRQVAAQEPTMTSLATLSLADVLAVQKRYEEALAVLEQEAAVASVAFAASWARGNILLKMEKRDDALAAFEQALAEPIDARQLAAFACDYLPLVAERNGKDAAARRIDDLCHAFPADHGLQELRRRYKA